MTSSEAPSPRYRLKFLPDALDEWNALDGSVKEVLKKLLKKRLEQPRVPGAELHGDLRDCYKIKLRMATPSGPMTVNHGVAWVFTHSRSASFMRVCQPGPPARKASRMS